MRPLSKKYSRKYFWAQPNVSKVLTFNNYSALNISLWQDLYNICDPFFGLFSTEIRIKQSPLHTLRSAARTKVTARSSLYRGVRIKVKIVHRCAMLAILSLVLNARSGKTAGQ